MIEVITVQEQLRRYAGQVEAWAPPAYRGLVDTLRFAADVIDQQAARIRELTPSEHERWVRCSPELVEMLRAAPSEPVIVSIEERPDGELGLRFTRYDSPAPRVA